MDYIPTMQGITLPPADAAKVRSWLGGEAREVEAVLRRDLSRLQFQACMRWLRTRGGWGAADGAQEEETLDVSTADGVRVSIAGREAIARFWNTQRVAADGVSVLRKRRADAPVELVEHDFRINCKTEDPLDDEAVQLHLRALPSLHKHFRLKKRVSLTRPADCPGVRIDLTQVRAAPARVVRPADSPLLSTPPHYEIEVELVERGDAEAGATALLRAMEAVLRALTDGFWPCGASVRDRVLTEYLGATGRKATALAHARKLPRQHFVGPMPVTLEREALPLAASQYCVTEKADGERYLAFADGEGRAYLLNNRLDVRGTDCELPAGTLLDGELVEAAPGRHRFMAFDVYLDAGKDVRSLPFLAERGRDARLARLRAVCGKPSDDHDDGGVTFRCKEFSEHGEDPAAAARRILLKSQAGQYPYRIDGLIFTPTALAVGASKPGDPASAAWGAGRWKAAFKWKPPQDNSIDFLVRFPEQGSLPTEGARLVMGEPPLAEPVVHRVLHLHVGFNTLYDRAIDAMTYLTTTGSAGGKYIARRFSPEGDEDDDAPYHEAYVPTPLRCANGDEVLEGSVVEFAYAGAADAPFSPFHWRPLRVRHDKTEEAARSDPPRVTANDHATANSVWRSVRDPVTEDMVTGRRAAQAQAQPKAEAEADAEAEAEVDVDPGVYYALPRAGEEGGMQRMRAFHNHHIKLHTLLLPLKAHKVQSLLDIGCGKGGDIHKWHQTGLRRVVGLDLYADNISNPFNGAYARLAQARKRLPHDARYVFVPYDASQPIDAVHINRMEDAGDRMVMQALWGTVPRQMVKPKELTPLYGLARERFDVVSCQFAVHYFCGSDELMRVFADNVSGNLRKGGFFVGACMDGERVRAALRDLPKGEELRATVDEGSGRAAWSIRKEYEEEDRHKRISVYVDSIGTRNEEYLVDVPALQALLEARGMRLEATGSFEDAYPAYLERVGQERGAMSDIERRFSFLNRYFVYRRQ